MPKFQNPYHHPAYRSTSPAMAGTPLPFASLTPAERAMIEIEIAKTKTNIATSFFHQRREENRAAAVAATNRRLQQEKKATDSVTSVVNADRELNKAAMLARVEAIAAPYLFDALMQETLLAADVRVVEGSNRLAGARRELLAIDRGIRSDEYFESYNRRIGAARKEARVSETLDLIPEPPKPTAPGAGMTLEQVIQYRDNLRADNLPEPEWVAEFIARATRRNGPPDLRAVGE